MKKSKTTWIVVILLALAVAAFFIGKKQGERKAQAN